MKIFVVTTQGIRSPDSQQSRKKVVIFSHSWSLQHVAVSISAAALAVADSLIELNFPKPNDR